MSSALAAHWLLDQMLASLLVLALKIELVVQLAGASLASDEGAYSMVAGSASSCIG